MAGGRPKGHLRVLYDRYRLCGFSHFMKMNVFHWNMLQDHNIFGSDQTINGFLDKNVAGGVPLAAHLFRPKICARILLNFD